MYVKNTTIPKWKSRAADMLGWWWVPCCYYHSRWLTTYVMLPDLAVAATLHLCTTIESAAYNTSTHCQAMQTLILAARIQEMYMCYKYDCQYYTYFPRNQGPAEADISVYADLTALLWKFGGEVPSCTIVLLHDKHVPIEYQYQGSLVMWLSHNI